MKAAVNPEVPFSEYQFILNSSLGFFSAPQPSVGAPEIAVNAGHCLDPEEAEPLVQIRSLKMSAPQPLA